MVNNKEVLYIKQGNRQTIIHTIKETIYRELTLDKLFDEWCLEELTTYVGRMEAIKKKYHLKKRVPLYINKNIMLFPTDTKKDIDNLYINLVAILEINKTLDNQTMIIFKNKEQIILNKDYDNIKKSYDKSLKIYNSIK